MSSFRIAFPDTPFEASSVGHNGASATGFGAGNLAFGSRGDSFKLSASTGNDLWMDWDMGSGQSVSASAFGIARANLLTSKGMEALQFMGSPQPYNLPSTISGLTCWLKADAGLTVENTNQVSAWADQSGNGYNFTQTTAGYRPTVVRHSSGHKALSFDGTDDFMLAGSAMSNVVTAAAHTVFIVLKHENSSVRNYILADEYGYLGFRRSSTNNWSVFSYDGTTDEVTKAASTDLAYIMHRHASGTMYLSTNGGAESSTTTGSISDLTGALRIGKGLEENEMLGYIFEILVYNTALSAGDIASVNEYLTAKYITTPTYSNAAFTASSLMGLAAEDYASAFTDISAARHLWLHYGARSGSQSNYEHSKVFISSGLDLGRDPTYQQTHERSGPQLGIRRQPLTFSLTWRGITEAKKQEFQARINQYRDVFPVMLIDVSDYVLNGRKAVHALVKKATIDPVNYNNYNLSLEFEEAI